MIHTTRDMIGQDYTCVCNGNETILASDQGFLPDMESIPTYIWIKFNTTDIPTSTIVKSAILELTGCGYGAATGNIHEFHSTNTSWSESTISGTTTRDPPTALEMLERSRRLKSLGINPYSTLTALAPYHCAREPVVETSYGIAANSGGKIVKRFDFSFSIEC